MLLAVEAIKSFNLPFACQMFVGPLLAKISRFTYRLCFIDLINKSFVS